MLFELAIIVALTLANGFIASEMAIVSARKVRLEQRAQAGAYGPATALEETPERGLLYQPEAVGVDE